MAYCRLPSGYHDLRHQVTIVSGLGRLEEASQTVLSWATHHKAGVQIQPSSELVADGAVAVLRLGVGTLAVRTPVRVVYVVNDGQGKGFAHGMLLRHQRSGKEPSSSNSTTTDG